MHVGLGERYPRDEHPDRELGGEAADRFAPREPDHRPDEAHRGEGEQREQQLPVQELQKYHSRFSADRRGGARPGGRLGPDKLLEDPSASPVRAWIVEELVQVPRQRDDERHRGEDRDSAPRAAPAAPRRREREARDEEHEGLLAQHPKTDGDARECRDAWAREALRGENRPSRNCHHRRLGRVEHELVELFDHERRAEREHDGQQARQWAERETPDVVAAER